MPSSIEVCAPVEPVRGSVPPVCGSDGVVEACDDVGVVEAAPVDAGMLAGALGVFVEVAVAVGEPGSCVQPLVG